MPASKPTTPPWLAVRCLAGRFLLSSPAWRPPAVRRNTPTTVRSPPARHSTIEEDPTDVGGSGVYPRGPGSTSLAPIRRNEGGGGVVTRSLRAFAMRVDARRSARRRASDAPTRPTPHRTHPCYQDSGCLVRSTAPARTARHDTHASTKCRPGNTHFGLRPSTSLALVGTAP